MLTSAEGKGTGLQWETLFTRDRPDDPLSMGSVLIMFMVDIHQLHSCSSGEFWEWENVENGM